MSHLLGDNEEVDQPSIGRALDHVARAFAKFIASENRWAERRWRPIFVRRLGRPGKVEKGLGLIDIFNNLKPRESSSYARGYRWLDGT